MGRLPARRRLTLTLDLGLLVAFVLLLSPRMTGLPLHEALGLAFCAPVVAHLLIARPWITRTTRGLLDTAGRRARVNYALNAALFTLVVLELVSGLAISQVALPGIGVATVNDRSWRALHNLALNWTLLAVGLHVAMNWDWIVAAARSRAGAPARTGGGSPNRVAAFGRSTAWIAGVLFAALLVAGGAFALLGPPSAARVYRQDEIARFAPTAAHGLGQFAGEAGLIALVAWAGRRWLRIRL